MGEIAYIILSQCCPERTPNFFGALLHYLTETGPALLIGFLLSGIINEFLPEKWVEKHLAGKGVKPIFYATLVGSILPICCWGALPVAVSFHRKGARLGPILAFLVATPGTSVSAFLVTWSVLGIEFAIFIFISVILMAIIMGLFVNIFVATEKSINNNAQCCCCESERVKKTYWEHSQSILRFAFVDMVKDIGLETLIGLVIAALVVSFDPVGHFVKLYLGGLPGFFFAIIFGILIYVCATSSPPMVDAFLARGLNPGASVTLLLVGPITNYGTLLVINKRFGVRMLFIYLSLLSVLSLALGYIYEIIF